MSENKEDKENKNSRLKFLKRTDSQNGNKLHPNFLSLDRSMNSNNLKILPNDSKLDVRRKMNIKN